VRLRFSLSFLVLLAFFATAADAQSPNGTISGLILDPTAKAIVGADVEIVNDTTGIEYPGVTNGEGIYAIPNLPPGPYRIQVSKFGFKTLIKPDVILNVQGALAINFTLPVGAIAETVTVSGGTSLVNTESATVSTVVDRQFAENLPLNGRSFQTLIQLTPGVVLTPYSNYDNGQFSVNGQRASSNYWMIDGVSGNVGIGTSNYSAGNGLSGANASLSVLGGTNSLVSVDAMQEFRIQTSTFAPEFGRTPGGQISIVTRSGSNRWNGSAFDYLRNDVFDANDWFADENGLPKPEERQNDFGATLSGPLLRNRTFFFFSYEGLRLRLPQVAQSLVPDLNARASAVPAMLPYFNAFPLPSPGTPDDKTNGIAEFNSSFSNGAQLDAYSLRVDHRLNNAWTVFGRYNNSPSTSSRRGAGTLNSVSPSKVTIQTSTVGLTWVPSASIVNDVRFNYSATDAKSFTFMDNFGGGAALASPPFPDGFNSSNSDLVMLWLSLGSAGPQPGFNGENRQRQANIVEGLTLQRGLHNIKFGVDYRRLSPSWGNAVYKQNVVFGDVPSSTTGAMEFDAVSSGRSGNFLFHNLGAYAQDSWKIKAALTITYGLRWDVDFAPSSNPPFLAVTGFDINNLTNLALAPTGTAPFHTSYGNIAPRIGLTYALTKSRNWQTVLRGGAGYFYDLATSEAGNSINPSYYPFGATVYALGSAFGGTSSFPLSAGDAAPPPITPDNLLFPGGAWGVFDPHLKLPYTLQWNVSVEQSLGSDQALSASYVGSSGRRLIQSAHVSAPDPQFGFVNLITNQAMSEYDALQVQFQRRLSNGLQVLASYSWSHSIDTASAGSYVGDGANAFLPSTINQNRGDSDFDIRNAFSAAITYQILTPRLSRFAEATLHGWSVQSIFQIRSAPPVNVYDGSFSYLQSFQAEIRPDLVASIPRYLYGTQYAGGKILNNTPDQGGPGCFGPFCPPPTDANGNPLRQGTLGRNALRAFGAWQWDFALHRDFPIRESLKLQFRAEMFNLLNHPNFGPPVSDMSNATQFGLATQTLGQSLTGSNVGSGAFNPLYQIGGPRSLQLALKLQF
jgi:hypothetical protein